LTTKVEKKSAKFYSRKHNLHATFESAVERALATAAGKHLCFDDKILAA
jgi:hypothetical protein